MSAPVAFKTSVSAGDSNDLRARNSYIDTLRGWSIFGVVCVHFGGSFANSQNAWTPSFYTGLFLNQFFSFAVPLFIFLSGYLAAQSSRKRSLAAYYKSRFVKIGLPYLAASIAAFCLLNHYSEWQALEGGRNRLIWVIQRLGFYGVEPTLYFIPLIIQFYILQPALIALPVWIGKIIPRSLQSTTTPKKIAVFLCVAFTALHLTLGILCYRERLNYYVWARPNLFFWLIYFFAGLHFTTLTSGLKKRTLLVAGTLCVAGLVTATVFDFTYLMDRSAVGANFERSCVDFAYSRPEILAFNLCAVGLLSLGIIKKLKWLSPVAELFGQQSLQIYLWHILALYYVAWRYQEALDSCKRMPELILIIAAGVCLGLALVARWIPRSIHFFRQYRVAISRVEN